MLCQDRSFHKALGRNGTASRPVPVVTRPKLRCAGRKQAVVRAFQGDDGKVPSSSRTAPASSTSGQAAMQSRTALLQAVQESAVLGNVYSKPLTKSELNALEAIFNHLLNSSDAPMRGEEAIRDYLLSLLKEAATTKKAHLEIVEGAMVVLEQMYIIKERKNPSEAGSFKCHMSREEMLCRWQLVIGADVGSIQYIPVVEELEVAADGKNFNLDTDLDWLFTGFSGDSSWLSPGHLQYHVQRVRIEFRQPKGWARAIKWWEWRQQQANRQQQNGAGPDYGMAAADAPTCRPNPNSSALDLPLPFPVNELFIFDSNGDLGVLRSKLGGLILLVNKTPKEQRARLLNTKK